MIPLVLCKIVRYRGTISGGLKVGGRGKAEKGAV